MRLNNLWTMLLAVTTGATSLACESGGVGDPCVPEDEYRSTFSGFSVDEVNIESRSFQCETRVCLVENFQGRVSCPYGQTEPELGAAAGDPVRCRIPGTDGSDPADAVAVAVEPQRVNRPPEDSVYCSCRCAGPDPNARYCNCPSGFECVPLVDDLGLGQAQLAGSYCAKEGKRIQDNPPAANCEKLAGPGSARSCAAGQYFDTDRQVPACGAVQGGVCGVNP